MVTETENRRDDAGKSIWWKEKLSKDKPGDTLQSLRNDQKRTWEECLNW